MRISTVPLTKRMRSAILASLISLALLPLSAAWAGPPFITDDPERSSESTGNSTSPHSMPTTRTGKKAPCPILRLTTESYPMCNCISISVKSISSINSMPVIA